MRAWREHKRLTGQQMAERMGVFRPGYTRMEQSGKPHRATLEAAASTLHIELARLPELYDDQPVSAPEDADCG